MDVLFGHTHSINMVIKTKTIPVEVIDGQPLLSGAIIEETIPLELIMGSHREIITFDLMSSPQHLVILGLAWLVTHNPIVDWRKQSLDFTTQIDKANNNLKVIHDIGASPSQVKPEEDHPAQAATTVEPSNSILSKYREFCNVRALRNVMWIKCQSIGRTTVQSTSRTISTWTSFYASVIRNKIRGYLCFILDLRMLFRKWLCKCN